MIQTERVPTGIVGLDPLLEGGLPKGRSILVTGEPGTGKTIFALQFLHAGVKRGENGVLVTADEAPIDVIEQAASLGWDLEPHIHKKELVILNAASYLGSLSNAAGDGHIDIERAVGDIAVIANQVGAQRLALDPAGPFLLTRDSVLHMQYQTRLLIRSLRASMPTTNILTSYAVPRADQCSMHGIEEYLVAGAVVLEMIWKDGVFARSLIVEKMRSTNVKPKQLDFDIMQDEGIVITTAE
jgi:circadian clock protein KaiC